MNDIELVGLRQRLESNPTDLELAKQYWNALGNYHGADIRSGSHVIDAFRHVALSSREGCAALANAYRELFELSGESPRTTYFDSELVQALEGWLEQLEGEEHMNLQWLLGFVASNLPSG